MGIDDSRNTAVVIGNAGGGILKEVSSTLQKAGFSVTTAASGRAALDLCRNHEHPVDLAVIDTSAAGVKTAEVAQQLHEMSPHVRMLFLSDHSRESLSDAELPGHLRKFLRKPFRRAQLLGRVLELMDQPRVFTA